MVFSHSRPVESAPDQITSALRERMLDGTLRAGTRLPSEEELAVAFGVSRPTVRIALRRLKVLGVITSERGRTGGHRVADPSPALLAAHVDGFITLALGGQQLTYDHLLDVRYELDVLAAKSAARSHTTEDRGVLANLAQELVAATDRPRTVEVALDLDLVAHREIAHASHNELLRGFISATVFAFRRSDFAASFNDPEPILRHLPEVLAAILDRDPDEAAAAMHLHHLAGRDHAGLP